MEQTELSHLWVLAFNKTQMDEPSLFDGETPWRQWLFFGASNAFRAFETEHGWFVLVAGQAVGGNLLALPGAAESDALAAAYEGWGGLVLSVEEALGRDWTGYHPPLLSLPAPAQNGPLLGLFALPFWAFEMQEAYLRIVEALFALFIFVYLQKNTQ